MGMRHLWIYMLVVVLNTALVFAPFIMPCVHYTLDNDLMQFFASGTYTGTPSEYTIYTNILHGLLLKSLYSITDGIAWYGVYEYISNILCANVFIYYIFKSGIGKIMSCLAFALLFVACMSIGIQPDYTTIAGELGLASLIIALQSDGKPKILILSYLLFLMGAVLRTQAVLIPFCVFFPLLVLRFVENKVFRCYSLSLLGALLFLVTVNKLYYDKDYGWRRYSEYNSLRMKINDNPSADDCVSLYSGNCEKREFRLLNEYRVNDGKILDTGKLSIATEFLRHRYVDNVLKNIRPYYYTYAYMLRFIVGIFLFALFVNMCQGNRRNVILIICSFLMFITANLYTMSISRPKEPVMFVLSASMILCSCIMAFGKRRFPQKWIYDTVAYVLIGGVIYLKGKGFVAAVIQNGEYIKESEICQTLCKEVDAPKILFHNATYCRMSVWSECKSPVAQKFVRVGWSVNSPHTEKFYCGLKSYVDNGLPMMINADYERYVDMIEMNLKEYYNIPVKRRILAKKGKMMVLKFERL